MTTATLTADYLIVGSGAVGMAFADTLLSETDASIVIIDRFQKPGGHWNVAYPFVTLHQPSAYYGVSSSELSRGRKDEVGLNQGLNDLATGAEVSAYFDDVMRHRFLPSGRVQYFPMCDYRGDGEFFSLLTGKTGIDACLWLLQNDVSPDAISWIMPRDAWLLDRRNTQSTEEFFADTIGALASQFEALASADSIVDLFDRLESAGALLRIDRSVRPSMFHGSTVSQAELVALRQIKNIVRMGRVQRIERDRIVLEKGEVPTSANHLHIDCSASAISNLEIKPIFAGDTITPQTVRSYQPVFSAAFIAHAEANYQTEEEKNTLCSVVPLPDHDTDWLRMMAAMMMNQYRWSQDAGIGKWLVENRLDAVSKMIRNIGEHEVEKQAIVGRMRGSAVPAMKNLQRLLAQIS